MSSDSNYNYSDDDENLDNAGNSDSDSGDINNFDYGSDQSNNEDEDKSETELDDNDRVCNQNNELIILVLFTRKILFNRFKTEIRDELKTMSFEDLIKLKQKLGSKVYNEAMFGSPSTAKNDKKSDKKEFKRANPNRPRELSSKYQVGFGLESTSKKHSEPQIVDPRFNVNCGDFDSKKFKKRYEFVNQLRETELKELKSKLKLTTDTEEKERLKFVMLRIKNQLVEENKRIDKEKQESEDINNRKTEQKDNKNPFYMKKSHKKAHELVKQYLDLKKSGKLEKHLEKRRKKIKARDRKKFSY